MKKTENVVKKQAAKAITQDVGSWTTPEAKNGLNDKLVMHIYVGNYAVNDVEGMTNYKDTKNVRCLVEDMEFTVESQYSTPFQESDPQNKLPAMHAMLSSGTLVDMAGVMGVGGDVEVSNDGDDSLVDKAMTKIEGMMHKTSFSKINSTQIYGSSGSIRMSGTVMLVAWDDASQVEDALRLLQAWSSPTHLSKESTAVNVAQGASDGWESGNGVIESSINAVEGVLDGIYQSVVPPIVSIRYGGKSYHGFYIESVSAPMNAPMNVNGERIAIKVQISFISRQAWDRADIEKLYRS
ncbi:MAG: hypothetical protein Q4B81_00155 [Moraxella sp.]|nr:hypothetical protein [Moraxella sp.]